MKKAMLNVVGCSPVVEDPFRARPLKSFTAAVGAAHQEEAPEEVLDLRWDRPVFLGGGEAGRGDGRLGAGEWGSFSKVRSSKRMAPRA